MGHSSSSRGTLQLKERGVLNRSEGSTTMRAESEPKVKTWAWIAGDLRLLPFLLSFLLPRPLSIPTYRKPDRDLEVIFFSFYLFIALLASQPMTLTRQEQQRQRLGRMIMIERGFQKSRWARERARERTRETELVGWRRYLVTTCYELLLTRPLADKNQKTGRERLKPSRENKVRKRKSGAPEESLRKRERVFGTCAH